MEGPLISVVIPAYNEERFLPRLLDSIAIAAQRFGSGADQVEVVIADNASTDATAEIARSRGCLVVPVEKRMIAAARNGGAARARGKVLAFVDADSVIHPDTFDKIAEAMADRREIGGATGVRFDRTSPGILLTYWLVKPLVRLMGLEGGVVFCFAEDFRQLGGYPEDDLVAEDVRFLMALMQLGRERKSRFRILKGVTTLTSARKFDAHGDWHFFAMLPALIFARIASPSRFRDFVQRYWYSR